MPGAPIKTKVRAVKRHPLSDDKYRAQPEKHTVIYDKERGQEFKFREPVPSAKR